MAPKTLFPISLCFLLGLLSLLQSACQSASTATAARQSGKDSLNWTVVAQGQQSGIEEAGHYLIKSQAEWERQVGNIESAQLPSMTAVDFDRYVLVACFMGMRRNGGFGLQIDGMQLSRGVLQVQVTHTQPGPSCLVTMAITQPFLIVKVPRKGVKEARFRLQQETRDC